MPNFNAAFLVYCRASDKSPRTLECGQTYRFASTPRETADLINDFSAKLIGSRPAKKLRARLHTSFGRAEKVALENASLLRLHKAHTD